LLARSKMQNEGEGNYTGAEQCSQQRWTPHYSRLVCGRNKPNSDSSRILLEHSAQQLNRSVEDASRWQYVTGRSPTTRGARGLCEPIPVCPPAGPHGIMPFVISLSTN
jgi:hypothetical protein